ncbi:MAG TPA: substrate-binding domain-containing protein [Streptosporangiaceae bacterium]|nr:substrate-binding domain-containing protein [Streptosporangiaceae bacterium]
MPGRTSRLIAAERAEPAQQAAHPSASTLTSIAAEAGVSLSTVSKVLNGRTDVAPDTRERIAQQLRRHGYEPGSKLGFGVVDLLLGAGECTVSAEHSPWAEALIHGTVVAAAEAAHSVVVTPVTSPSEFDRWLSLAAVRGTHGALSVLHLPRGTELQRLAEAGIPVVVVDPAEEPGANVRSVGTTNWQGGLTATRHLIELGHRRIAAISGPLSLWSSRARLDGYRAAMLEAGLRVDEELIVHDAFSVSGGRTQAMRLLGMADRPTGIVAGSDAQAFGVLQALSLLRLRAPDDVSVVGFDDVPVATWAAPALTTVRQPLAAMAATAFRMLRPSGADAAAEPHHIELATTLVVRDSTGPPPDRA